MFKSIATYCKESYDELVHKVTWPTRKELINSAVIVLSASIVIAFVVWVMDSVFKALTDLVYKFF
jgi:preprotein translocase subunit SecE